MKKIIFILFIFLCQPLFAATSNEIGPSQIKELIKSYLLKSYGGQGSDKVVIKNINVDDRIKMPACEKDPIVDLSMQAQNISGGLKTVSVTCEGPMRWQIYVQTELQIKTNVVVFAHNVNRGTVLGDYDVKVMEMDVMQLHDGYFKDPKEVVGKMIKMPAQVGTIINPRSLQAPPVVLRGEVVTIEASSGAVKVEMNGVAQQDGGIGETVSVINQSSKRTVQTVVIGPKRVRANL